MAARSSTRERRRLAAAIACLVACGLPRDPQGTAERVAALGLRVGVVLDSPWACTSARSALAGADVALIRDLARAQELDVTFTTGGETRLLAALRRFELDLVVGGLVADSPWADEVGFTRDYHQDPDGEHVWAVPPGESAWLMQVERFLGGADVAGALARGRAECEAA